MNSKPVKFPGESIEFITPSWDDMNALCFQIAQKILSDHKNFDRIVTLAKGGWPMTRSLVDFLSLNSVASIGIKFYSGINQRMKTPRVYQDLPIDIKGEKILLFDDVADTGKSLKFVTDHLLKKGAKTITTATLFYKPHSTVKPDYFAYTTSAWIIFPYDAVEAIQILGSKWQKQGLSQAEIKTRLLKLNIPKNWLEAYMSLTSKND